MPDPTPQILESARRFRRQLLARERRAASAMVRYYGDTWRRLQPEIRALQAEVDGMADVSVARIGRLQRLRSIEAQAQQQLLQFTEYADDAIRGAEREAIAAAERDAPALMRAAYPPDAPITIRFDRMPRESVENLVGFLRDGSPLADLLADAVGDAADNFASTMVTGMAAGWNPRRLARALRSEFGMGLTQALKISRTEQLRAYRTTSLNAYRTSNVCTGWEWLATLSPRTCMACLEKDGTRYSLDQEFEDHVQGRCAPVPITKSYAEMGIDAPEPDFTREKGHDWFLRQDEGVQRRVLGGGKFDAWKNGQFKLEDVPKLTRSTVWGNSWTPKTLQELVAIEPDWLRRHPVLKPSREMITVTGEHGLIEDILTGLEKIPQKVMRELQEDGVEIYVGRGTVPELDDMKRLQGKSPRGWPSDMTWDDVKACYDRANKRVILGTGKFERYFLEHQPVRERVLVVLHEVGHAVDGLGPMDRAWSQWSEFGGIHREVYAFVPQYYQQGGPGGFVGREELFAQGFAEAIYDEPRGRRNLRDAVIDYVLKTIR